MSEPVLAPREELTASFASGIDLGRIQQLLKQAREKGGPSQETVATLNLVAVYFTEAQAERALPALDAAAALHPCRLLVLIANVVAEGRGLSARVSVSRQAGAITGERIVLEADGKGARHLESALGALLVPELPLVVVWGGRPEGGLLQQVLERADRVIIDSGARPPGWLHKLTQLLDKGAPVGDLAWPRIFPWQSLAAECLDLPNLREHRGRLRSARVVCAGAIGAEGVLLAGWLKARIPALEVELVAEGEAAAPETLPPAAAIPHAAPLSLGQVNRFSFTAPPATFTFRREKGILIAEVKGDDDGDCLHRVRLPVESPGRLLALELKLLSGVDELYAASVRAGVRLLAGRRP